MSQSQFKITVEDGTMIEVKVDKAKKSTIELFIFFMEWLNIWTVMTN